MKTLVKGGVWKNTEDEILKAAVSKYGKNQWARISSLLVRKTPKQCKARWFEWLDPSIKKTEWSKEEDEKLLHLAKLMPTQWRTIAPIVGRTSAQCLERYQRLLDEAENREGDDDLGLSGGLGPESAPSAEAIRKLRPGEIDPEPEAKPARPDPVDMDEDEKEMLSEARARLANTQGKKAKRKARERQLEEARRLTSLQKRRELKAAGITMRMKKRKGEMDYNADIPFEKKAPLGFYDVIDEKNRPVETNKLTNVHLSKLNRRRADIEEEKQQEKKRKGKESGPEGNQGRFVPAKDAKILKIQEQEQIAKRRKLVLPAPQVGEQELEEIVKAGFAGESAKSLVQDDEDGETATQGLVSDYAVTPSRHTARTPRTPAVGNTIAEEARNLRALTAAQTPLLGEENPAISLEGGMGFDGATPRHAIAQTPNPMATPLRGTPGAKTPAAGSQTPFKTPLRDHFKINDQGLPVGGTPREERMQQVAKRRSLADSLKSLPKPRNEWEIRLPEMEDEVDEEERNSKATPMVEDMSDIERRQKELAEKEETERIGRRSQAVQLNLPRPTRLPPPEQVEDGDEIQQLIQDEYMRLLKHDSIKYPVAGSKVAPGLTSLGELASLEDEFDAEALANARKDMEKEVAIQLNLSEDQNVKDAVWLHIRSHANFEEIWKSQHDDLFFSADENRFVTLEEIPNDKDKIRGLSKTVESNRQTMIRDASRAGKLEKKLDVRLGGYMARSKTLAEQLSSAYEELNKARMEFDIFTTLQIAERAAAPRRIIALKEDLHRLEQRESELQQKYKALSDEKEALLGAELA